MDLSANKVRLISNFSVANFQRRIYVLLNSSRKQLHAIVIEKRFHPELLLLVLVFLSKDDTEVIRRHFDCIFYFQTIL